MTVNYWQLWLPVVHRKDDVDRVKTSWYGMALPNKTFFTVKITSITLNPN